MSSFSLRKGSCSLVKLMSSCMCRFNTSACDTFSWSWSPFFFSRLSCHLNSVMSLLQASCSSKSSNQYWITSLLTGFRNNWILLLHRRQIDLWESDASRLLTFLDESRVLGLPPQWNAVNFAFQSVSFSFLILQGLLGVLSISLQMLNQMHNLAKNIIHFLLQWGSLTPVYRMKTPDDWHSLSTQQTTHKFSFKKLFYIKLQTKLRHCVLKS